MQPHRHQPSAWRTFALYPFAVVAFVTVLLSLHEAFIGSHVALAPLPDYPLLRSSVPKADSDHNVPSKSTDGTHLVQKRNSPAKLVHPSVARQLTLPHHVDEGSRANVTRKAGSLPILTGKDCVCELLSVDCLDSIRCLASWSSAAPHAPQQSVAMGVMTRKAMKQASIFEGSDEPWRLAPIGKGLQYSSISAWRNWIQESPLPVRYWSEPSIFVNETWYKFCREHNLVGKACFFGDLDSLEDMSELEMDSMLHSKLPSETEGLIQADVKHFRQQHSKQPHMLPNLGYLMTFAHMVRVRFHMQPFMKDIFEKRLQRIRHVDTTSDGTILRVSLHMRRADACDHLQDGYETQGSPIDSPAQTSGKRKCYATSVYLNALKRVQKNVPTGTTIEVYLSTDHAGSVMDEIRDGCGELYRSMNWHYLNYSSEKTFHYEGMIEGSDVDSAKQALLGESAVADLFLVSHGEVFIGHLGSRFGKLSWLLATARRNAFVPFFSVDGHSYCCEIDEACARAKPYIQSMVNCMTFSHEMTHEIPTNKDYWEVGSRVREQYVKSLKKGRGKAE